VRVHVEPTGSALTGWAKQETQTPTACMMRTNFSAVMVSKVGSQRQLAQPLSAVQQHSLLAVGVPAAYFTGPQSGCRAEEGRCQRTLSPREAGDGAWRVIGGCLIPRGFLSVLPAGRYQADQAPDGVRPQEEERPDLPAPDIVQIKPA
jgi:hypothetical protein